MRGRGGSPIPWPLLATFTLFVAFLAALVAASLSRGRVRGFAPSPPTRVRSAAWAAAGDTLTLDARDGARWRHASLSLGRPLADAETARWDIAARRYHLAVAGELTDLGPVPFDAARLDGRPPLAAARPGARARDTLDRWYRYSFVTHLLTPRGHVYALRAPDGRLWKLELLGYYCPGLAAGCVTLRYAPLAPSAPPGTRRPTVP